eukprot:4113770-Alexandrium_andersonii.AAC.1
MQRPDADMAHSLTYPMNGQRQSSPNQRHSRADDMATPVTPCELCKVDKQGAHGNDNATEAQ